jgi:serine/threonine protein kinase/WD40 repeat protein
MTPSHDRRSGQLTTSGADSPPPSEDDPRVVAALKEYESELQAGRTPDRQAFLDRHQEIASALRQALEALDFLRAAGPSGGPHVRGADTPQTATGLALSPPAVLGDFRIVRQLGQGGMGVVFEAVQQSLGRHVALKVLPPAAARTPTQRERFRREAQAAGRLHHSNIVPVFGVGDQDGLLFFAMQLIDGAPLDAVVRELKSLRSAPGSPAGRGELGPRLLGDDWRASGTQAPPDGSAGVSFYRGVARLGAQAAEGLEYAHRQGVLHRDVKPANFLLDAHGALWITDFGLAWVEGAEELTSSGAVVGTLRYLAPERFAGRADARSDVYGLGVTLYELLTLTPAFPQSDRLRLVEQITHGTPARPRHLDRHVPRDLETIVLKAADREPARRYGSAGELAEDLRRFLADQPIRARPLGPLGRLAKWARRRPGLALLLGALLASLLTLAGLAGWSYWSITRALAEKDQALLQKGEALAAKETEAANAVTARNKAKAEEANAVAARNKAEAETARALLNEERLLRSAHESGWRKKALDNLGRLAEMKTPEQDLVALRTEAVACLESLDLIERRRLLPLDLGPLYTLDFSPDGATLLTAAAGGLPVWDVTTGRRSWFVNEPNVRLFGALTLTATAGGALFRPDSNQIAYLTTDKALVVLDRGTKALAFPRLTSSIPARSLAFDRAGRRLAVSRLESETDARFTVYDADTGALRREVRVSGPFGLMLPVALSTAGDWLATPGPAEASVQLHPLGGGDPVSLGTSPRERVIGLCFSPDAGTRKGVLASASGSTLRVWDVERRRERFVLGGHTDILRHIAFTPDGQFLVSEGDSSLRLWETRHGRPVFELHRDGSGGGPLALSPDGTYLATSWAPEQHLKLFQFAGRRERRLLPTGGVRVIASALHPGRPLAASGGLDHRTVLWDLETARPVWTAQEADNTWPLALAFHPGGDVLAVAAGYTTKGILYLPGEKKEADGFGPPAKFPRPEERPPTTVWLCDVRTGKERRRLAVLPGQVAALAFDPAGKRLAAAAGSVVMLWEVPTGKEVFRWSLDGAVVDGQLAFLDNGAALAVLTGPRSTLRILDAVTGRPVREASVAEGAGDMAVSPDEKLVAVAAGWGTVQVLSLPHLRVVTTRPRAQPGGATRPAFSPDGRLLVTGGLDREVFLWEPRTLTRLCSLPRENLPVRSCGFSADGRFLLVRGDDQDITVHDIRLIRSQLAAIGLDW